MRQENSIHRLEGLAVEDVTIANHAQLWWQNAGRLLVLACRNLHLYVYMVVA